MKVLLLLSNFIFLIIFHTDSSPTEQPEKDPDASNKIRDHPWLVSLQWYNRHICAGSIISENLVLTSGDCISNSYRSNLTIVAGNSSVHAGGPKHQVIITRKLVTDDYDMAMLKVSPSFEFGSNVNKIKLVDMMDYTRPGENVSMSGWGKVDEKEDTLLSDAWLSIVPCKPQISSSQICAGLANVEVCVGDLGSPLITSYGVQVGIMRNDSACASPQHPRVYTKIAYHRDWIDESIHKLNAIWKIGSEVLNIL